MLPVGYDSFIGVGLDELVNRIAKEMITFFKILLITLVLLFVSFLISTLFYPFLPHIIRRNGSYSNPILTFVINHINRLKYFVNSLKNFKRFKCNSMTKSQLWSFIAKLFNKSLPLVQL